MLDKEMEEALLWHEVMEDEVLEERMLEAEHFERREEMNKKEER